MRSLRVVLFLFATLMSANSFAQIMQQNSDQATKKKVWGGFYNINYDNNLKGQNNPQNDASLSPMLVLDHRLQDGHTIRMSGGFTKMYNGEQDTLIDDSSLQYRKMHMFGKIMYLNAVSLLIPISKQSHKNAGLTTSVSYRPVIIPDLEGMFGFTKLGLVYIPSITQNFHKYTTSMTGQSNSRRSFGQTLVFEYPFFNGKILINVGGNYAMSWTYENKRNNDMFSFFESIAYQFNPKTNVSIGHTNRASIYMANGYSNNVSLYNPNTSSYYLSFMQTF